MGPHAACAFFLGRAGAQVIAFSPQSTLSPALVPWEARFPSGRAADWSGDFADAAAQTASARTVFLVYDPTEPADAAHADRFTGDNIVRLRTPRAGHKTALRLRQTDMLSTVVRGLATRTMDAAAFHALYRQSRLQPWYLDTLGQRLQARGPDRLAAAAVRHRGPQRPARHGQGAGDARRRPRAAPVLTHAATESARMPRKTAPQPQPVPAGPDIALHMLMNDSAPVLLDWVLHHRHAGFRSITVHGDGANAQATALAQALAAAGLIDFVPTTRPGIAHDKARQIRALDLALETALRDRHDHLLWLEPDDFVMIDTGAGTLADLAQGLERFPDLLSLTVQVAGGSGQNRYADLPLVERFRRGTGGAAGRMTVATPLRTIFRPQLARGLKPARPTLKPKFARGKEPVTWLNGAAEDVADRYLQKGWMTMPDQPGLGLAHVIAFMAQDRETFLLRRTGAGKTLPFVTPDHLRMTIQQYQRLNHDGRYRS